MSRLAATVLGAVALLGMLATPAVAIPDPVATVDCAVQEVTGLVSLGALAVPTAVPGTGCLALAP